MKSKNIEKREKTKSRSTDIILRMTAEFPGTTMYYDDTMMMGSVSFFFSRFEF